MALLLACYAFLFFLHCDVSTTFPLSLSALVLLLQVHALLIMHDSALVTEVLEKVKLLLPDIVRDCVTTALGIHNATGKPTADKVSPSDAFEKRLHSLERQIKKINESIKSINIRSAANFKTLYDEISRCENLTDKSKKELTALRGSISSLQKQCNKLKNVQSSTSEYPIEKDTDNASNVTLPSSASLLNEITKLKNTLSSTSVNSNPDILTIKEDIMNLKKKCIKLMTSSIFRTLSPTNTIALVNHVWRVLNSSLMWKTDCELSYKRV